MRTTLISLVAAAATLAPSVAAAQRGETASASTDLILAIDARRTSESGTSSAGDHGNTSFSSYTYAVASDLCGLGTGDNEPSRLPWLGWYYTGEILGSSIGAAGPELNVRITWERRWNNGARTTDGPRGTNTVTMRAGDVLVLDRVTPATAGRCGAELRLEASVMTSASRFRGMRGMAGGRGGFTAAGGGGMGRGSVATGGGRGGGGGAAVAGTAGAGGAATGTAGGGTAATAGVGRGGRGGTGAGGTAASGGGTGTTAVAGRGGRGGGATAGGAGAATAGGGTTGMGGRGGGRGGASSATGGVGTADTTQAATAGAGRGGRGGTVSGSARDLYVALTDRRATHTAEVWLLHRTPDNVEHVQQQTIPFGAAGREFTFPPVAVNTSRGVVMVDITGSLRVTDGRIAIGLGRRARASGTPALDTTGTSEMTFELPKPEEVLSFEFPALQKPAEDLLAKHKFSVRVRIK